MSVSEPEQEPTWEGLGAEGYKNYHEGYTYSKKVLSVAELQKFVITFESGGYKKKVQVKKQFSLQAAAQVHLGRYLPVQKNNGKPEPFGATLDRFKALWLEVKGEEFLLSAASETTTKQALKNRVKALEENLMLKSGEYEALRVRLLETQTTAEEQRARARKWKAQAKKTPELATAVSACFVPFPVLCCYEQLCVVK